MRVVGNLGVPFGCNSPVFSDAIKTKTAAFKQSEGIKTLAYRYAYNLANGRFLSAQPCWCRRNNRYGQSRDSSFVFNAYDFSLNEFEKSRDNARTYSS